MFDLIVRSATLPDGRVADIAARDGVITAVETGITAAARETIEASGCLVTPPFVDPHFHMDATLSLGLPRRNRSGTLLEGIALWGELKPTLTREAIVERALRYCDLAVAQGIGAIRSHVDISEPRLVTVEALLEVKALVADYLDLQLVAFPQDGYFRAPGAEAAMVRALDMGVDVVGAETVREPDGLALSSRNVHLDEDQRRQATALSRTLYAAAENAVYGAGPALDAARAVLRESDGVDLDYLEITTPDLDPLPEDPAPGTEARILIAARVGTTRLIDNLPLTIGRID